MVNLGIGWLPVFVLLGGIILILAADLKLREKAKDVTASLATLTLITTILSVIYVKGSNSSDLFFYGDFFVFFSLVGLFSSIIVVFVAWRDMDLELDIGVFFSLLLLANMGGIVIASARHMVVLYVGYELVSLPSYAMAAFKKRDKKAAEAALKFFLLGALSSAIIVYGLTMYYGATGSLFMGAESLSGSEGLKFAAIVLIASGSGFKIGLVPFHFWIADVYSGSPLSVVVWLAASSKKMAFAFVIQLFFVGMVHWRDTWSVIFIALSIFSMLLGNIAAVIQSSVMRILAYSTIAQAGYIVIGFAAFGVAKTEASAELAIWGIGVQVIAHILMKGTAIVATFVIIDNFGNSNLENFRGLFKKNKLVSVSLMLALFSLMGIPPLLGAFGKWYLFLAAVENDLTYLAIIALVGSAISIYYYVKIMMMMMSDPVDDNPIKVTTPIKVTLVLLSILTVVLPLFLERILNSLSAVASELFPL